MTAPPQPAPAPENVRIMVVDDSSVVRRLLTEVLVGEPDFEVVSTASNGEEALARLESSKPHVVILDIEMPILDGLGTLRRLRQRWPQLPVIMFSTLTERGAIATLDALSHGANDYVTKPTESGTVASSMNTVRASLVPLVRTWGGIGRRRSQRSGAALSGPPVGISRDGGMSNVGVIGAPGRGARPGLTLKAASFHRPRVEAIVIGSSTGGPNALAELIPELPADLPVPVLVVQHMPEMFTQLLAQRLDQKSGLTVVEAEPGSIVEPNHIYVAKGGIHMVVKRTADGVALAHDNGPAENSCKPSVDVLFRSAVRVWGGGLLGVILTGMGQDGLLGATAIDAAGGAVVAQDEATSVVWGMPGAVACAGLASEILPLNLIGQAITRRVALAAKAGSL